AAGKLSKAEIEEAVVNDRPPRYRLAEVVNNARPSVLIGVSGAAASALASRPACARQAAGDADRQGRRARAAV
ncbi:hypothetical protein ACSHWI_15940, partial [Methylococcus sp. S2T]